MARDDARYAGRVVYWFNQDSFTATWFHHQFEKARKGLGSRYTPETNVELPIRRDFIAFARAPTLNLEIHNWHLKVNETSHTAIRAIQGAEDNRTEHTGEVAAALERLTNTVSSIPIAADQPFPIADWVRAGNSLAESLGAALKWTYELPPQPKETTGTSPVDWAKHSLYSASDALNGLIENLGSQRWRLANSSTLLLYGTAGTGKSHLLADVVEHQIATGSPALLVLGSTFVDGDP